MNPREENLLRSITVTTWKFYAWVGFLCVVLALICDGLIICLNKLLTPWRQRTVTS